MLLWCRNIFACFGVLVAMLSLFACGGASSPVCKVDGDTLSMRYSSLLSMVECDSFTIADVKNPWREGVVQRYVILPHVEGYTLGQGTWDTLERHKAHHAAEGNGFGYGLHKMPIQENEVTRTISARYHKDGAEILIEQPGQRPRRLTV